MSMLELSVPLHISVLICNRIQKHIKRKYIKTITNFHNLLGRQTIMLKHSCLGINSLGSSFGMTTYSMILGKLHKYLWFYLFIHKNNKNLWSCITSKWDNGRPAEQSLTNSKYLALWHMLRDKNQSRQKVLYTPQENLPVMLKINGWVWVLAQKEKNRMGKGRERR